MPNTPKPIKPSKERVRKYDATLKFLWDIGGHDSLRKGLNWGTVDWKDWKFEFNYSKGNPNTWYGLWFIWKTPIFQLGLYA